MTDKKPDFSDVIAGSSSTAEPPSSVAPPAPRSYVVQKGDSLSKIAAKFYGNTKSWRLIFEANRERIKDPDLIQPGWQLTIPDGDGASGPDVDGDKGGVA